MKYSYSKNSVFLRSAVVFILLLTGWNISYAQSSVDYQSLVATGSSSVIPVGYGYHDLSAYTAYGMVWVFYSDGENAVYRSKPGEEGGEWSETQIIFNEGEGRDFNVAFDGEYFHFIHENEGDLNYMRGRALLDGSIRFDQEVTVYSNNTWNASNRHFSIGVDHRGKPWVIVKVTDDELFKPILLSSIASDGTWINRPGFPKDLSGVNSNGVHGRAPNVIEIDEGKVLVKWRNHVDPSSNMYARLWSASGDPDGEGTLGDLENTQLSAISSRSSIVAPGTGIALVNSSAEVSRRNANGTWELVTPDGMNVSTYNTLSVRDGVVRLWDLDNGNLRYRETSNNGSSWGSVQVKWSDPDIKQFNASQAKGSHGQYHSVLWVTGTGEESQPPFDVYMGIEGSIDPPPVPELASPEDGQEGVSTEITLRWSEIPAAASYDVQVSQESNFSSTVVNEEGVTDTSLTVVDLQIDTIHYWRVRSSTSEGAKSDWTDAWSFKTAGIPPQPTLVSPENGAVDQLTSLELEWNPITGVDRYHLQVSTDQDFSTTFFDDENLTEASFVIDGLDNDRTYYWRVRAINDFGTGEWSATWSFTTRIAVPDAPVLTSPENEAENVLTTVEFSWDSVATATSYRLQVSTQSNFASTVINVGNITNTSYEVTNLDHSTTYYWRVNASNESGPGNWSNVRNYTTIIADPAVPVLASPADSLEDVSTRPLLQWNEAARAETYRVQVATDNEFSSIVLDQSEVDSLQYTVVDELDEFTTHYWRVNATNIGGTSDWSEIWMFTTDQAFPVSPELVGPEDGTTDVEDATLFWNSVPTATQYRIQISKEPDFSADIAVDKDDITNTFYQATNLEKWTTYYWRVRGISHVGQGYWSETWSFETGDIVSVDRVDNTIPDEFALGQNYPNPFNPVTTIQFALPKEANVRLEIYNMLGQRVASVINGEHHSAGMYQVTWDARDDSGNEVSSGIYIYRISAGEFNETRKMILMK